MAVDIKTASFGGNGGGAFEKQVVDNISIRTGKFVDQIKINNVQHGGNGGGDRGSIVLNDNEYINTVELRSGSYIDFVKFTTNEGRVMGGGGSGGGHHLLENIRVLAIGGRTGAYVDKLDILYIDNYDSSSTDDYKDVMNNLSKEAKL